MNPNLFSRSCRPPAPLPTVYHPLGAPFASVYFTEYPLKPEYKEFILENILEKDPLAQSNLQVRYDRQGPWHYTKPLLSRDKYNSLSVYQLDMAPPITLVMNAAIYHVSISPSMGYFEDKSLSFAFFPQNEPISKLGNTIVWFLDSAQLTCPTHACGK
ncbi:hypothetical protein DSO57_1011880 [Entomophthora muscae]|uniref:Uncharacterized protein n=1 Tax=Entomophthora muscae TaxID=34485 RepID=A0ACC2RX62_9FUNG|nr:hypothetical protein DSO57_1011880 [Entomophthora muscae]